MNIKRIFAMLLSVVLVLGIFPPAAFPLFSLKVEAVTNDDIITDTYAKTVKIFTGAGWTQFKDLVPNHSGMAGWTVTLENDIDFTSDIAAVRDFKGIFDGKKHYIKVTGSRKFTDIGHESVGLFGNLKESGTIRNLIMWVDGTLTSPDPVGSGMTTYTRNYGALVGKMEGSSKLENCALVGNGTIKYNQFFEISSNSISVGSMVGLMTGSSKISGCYSELNVVSEPTFADTDNGSLGIDTGGIVGSIFDVNGTVTISDTAYLGTKIDIINKTKNTQNFGGGIIGSSVAGYDISNCFVKNVTITAKGENGATPIEAILGYLAGSYMPDSRNCYAFGTLKDSKLDDNNNIGYVLDISKINANTMGGSWIDTKAGFPSLSWLVTEAPKLTVNTDDANAAITMNPTYANYSVGTTYNKDKDSRWMFDISIPIKGRTAPITNGVQLVKKSGGESTITAVTVSDNTNPVQTEYYSGLTYPFLATVTGSNLGQLNPANLSWTANATHATGSNGSVNITKTGQLTIAPTFFGTVDIKATYNGIESPLKTIEVKRGKVELGNKTIAIGGSEYIDATATASQAVLDTEWWVGATWSVEPPDKGITVSSDGLVTVAGTATGSTTATVTAKVLGMADATAKVTVTDPAAATDVTIDLTDAQANHSKPGTATIDVGQSVIMTITPHVGTLDRYNWWEESGTTIEGAPQTTYTYKGTEPGKKVFRAAQLMHNGESYIAEFTITVNAPTLDTVPDHVENRVNSPNPANPSGITTDDLGGGTGSSVYSLTLIPLSGQTVYYKTLAASADVDYELSYIYTSASELISTGHYMMYPSSGIVLTATGNTFSEKELLLVAVDNDIGTIMPSGVTQFTLPIKLPDKTDDLVCANINKVAQATNMRTAELKDQYYTKDMNKTTDAPADVPLLWTTVLSKVITNTGEVKPESIDYIATGEIKFKTWPEKDRFGKDPATSRFVAGEAVSGGSEPGSPTVTRKPTILPNDAGTIIDAAGVTITAEPGAKILYTATKNVFSPVIPKVDLENGNPIGEDTKVYTNGNPIPFPAQATSFVVCAVAWKTGQKISDIEYVLYKNDNLEKPVNPRLFLNKAGYNENSTYPEASKITFEHPDLAHGEIWFTDNNENPSSSGANTKIFRSSGGDDSIIFSPDKPYTMSSLSERVTIKAIFYDTNKLRNSDMAVFYVTTKQKLSPPVANLISDTMVRPNEKLELTLSDAAITQLNTKSPVRVEKITYDATMDSGAIGNPIVGTQYISYSVNETTQSYTLPPIRYILGDDTTNIVRDGRLYQYGQRREVSSNGKKTVTYINPQPIILSGAAGSQTKVNAIAISLVEARSNSDIITLRYTIRGAVGNPTAFPETDPAKPAAINIGDRIALSSVTPDAMIFYTTDGTAPQVTFDGKIWTGGINTKLYNETDAIKMENNSQLLFMIRAIAVSKDDSLEKSQPSLFRYQLPAPVQAVFSSPVQGAVVANQEIKLQCATEGAKIFYRVFTKKPDITKPENIPTPGKDQIFDGTIPIVITKATWIVTVAEKNGAMSLPTVSEYTVSSKLADPFASIKTGSVVYKGTRIRLNASGSIAFTVDGSDPKAGMAAASKPSSSSSSSSSSSDNKDDKKDEVLYGDSVVIDADYGKSVTVRAFCYGEGKSPSNTVSFTYTVCEKDAYLVAAPVSESVVTSGDNITLTTGISDGMVFYTVGSATPTVKNQYSKNKKWREKDAYTHYQWAESSRTEKGNSVKVTGEPGSTFTIKATAVANGSEGGTVSVFTYTIRNRTSAPTASIPSGAVVFDGATVTLTAQEGDIFYTTDGTEPSTSSRIYLEPIKVTGSMVLKAIAVAKDKVQSNSVEYIYSYADQVFAPTMSTPGGEIEQGTRISLTTQTKDATIYYTTNGVDPTKDSTLYTSPITVMRPVTIKAVAILKNMRDSAVNTASYTVIETELPPLNDSEGTGKAQVALDSLVSRRTYFDANAGPKFTGVVINDAETNAILSADVGTVPKSARLVAKQINISDSDKEAVRSALGYQIVTLYDISLENEGEQIQPTGEVEIGIPIPSECQNGIVTICRVGVDNTVEEYKPRRSGNNAYITVDGKLDRYAVTVPTMSVNGSGGLLNWKILLIGGVGILGSGGVGLLTVHLLKKRRKNSKN